MPFIYDICHGYIPYNDTETRFLDNHWVKRLKRIKQLGLLEDENLIKLLQKADYVVLSSSMRGAHIDFLEESLKKLSKLTNAEIILFGNKT